MNIAVTGGRSNRNWDALSCGLDQVKHLVGNMTLIAGGARGVDTLAEKWARLSRVHCEVIRAEWGQHGRYAGLKRNVLMACRCEGLVSFAGGRGTDHMTHLCVSKGLPVWHVDGEGVVTFCEGTEQLSLF